MSAAAAEGATARISIVHFYTHLEHRPHNPVDLQRGPQLVLNLGDAPLRAARLHRCSCKEEQRVDRRLQNTVEEDNGATWYRGRWGKRLSHVHRHLDAHAP